MPVWPPLGRTNHPPLRPPVVGERRERPPRVETAARRRRTGWRRRSRGRSGAPGRGATSASGWSGAASRGHLRSASQSRLGSRAAAPAGSDCLATRRTEVRNSHGPMTAILRGFLPSLSTDHTSRSTRPGRTTRREDRVSSRDGLPSSPGRGFDKDRRGRTRRSCLECSAVAGCTRCRRSSDHLVTKRWLDGFANGVS